MYLQQQLMPVNPAYVQRKVISLQRYLQLSNPKSGPIHVAFRIFHICLMKMC